MKRLICLALVFLVCGCVGQEQAPPFRDDFAGECGQWHVLSGEWLIRGGKCRMMTKGWGRQIILAARSLTNGSVSGTARPTGPVTSSN